MEGIADHRAELKIANAALNNEFSVLIIDGPDGVGKTTLLKEILKRNAAMFHSCKPSEEPWTAVRGLLDSVERTDIVSEAYGEVVSAYGIHRNTGILIDEVSRGGGLDGDVFAGMLSAVQAFVRDSLSMLSSDTEEGYLSSLSYGEYRIIVARGKYVDLVVVVRGIEEYSLKAELIKTVKEFEEIYYGDLEHWDGNISKLNLRPMLERFFSSPARMDMLVSTLLSGFISLLKEYVIAIDDVQWLDIRSQELVRLLIQRAAQNKVGKFIFTLNSETVTTEGIEELFVGYPVQWIHLGNMDMESVAEFIKYYYPDNLFSQEFVSRVHLCTSGNPLSMLNLLNDLKKRKVIWVEDGFWVSSYFECSYSVDILDGFSKDERDIVAILAAMGFGTADFLTEVLDMKKFQVFRLLRRLEKLGIMEKRGGDYVFSHESIRKMLLNSADYNETYEILDVAADYYLEKGQKHRAASILENIRPEDAASLYSELAEDAKRTGLLRDAVIYYRKASELSKNDELIVEAGELLIKLGEYEKAADILESVLNQPHGFEEYALAKAHLGELVDVEDEFLSAKVNAIAKFHQGDFKGAIKSANQALDIKEDFEMLVLAGECSVILGLPFEDYYARAEELEADVSEHLLLARKKLYGMIYKGKIDDAIRMADKELRIARDSGSWKEVASLLNLKANAYMIKGLQERAMLSLFEALRYAEMQSDLNLTSIILGNIALNFLSTGEYKKALKYQRKVLRIFEISSNAHGVAFTKLDIGISYLGMGEWEEARKWLEESVEELNAIGDVSTKLYAEYHLLALEYATRGDCSTAAELQGIYEEFRNLDDIYAQLELAGMQAIVDKLCGQKSHAIGDMLEHSKQLSDNGKKIMNLVYGKSNTFQFKNALYNLFAERLKEQDNMHKNKNQANNE